MALFIPWTPRRTAGSTTPDPALASSAILLDEPAPETGTRPLGDVERARALQQAVQHASRYGAQIVSTSAHRAVIDHRLTPAYRRHLLDSGCSSCSWASALALTPARTSVLGAGRLYRLQLTVDEFGVITTHPAPPPPGQ